jgi:magnesium-transporting ATPase (P-type)
MCSVIRDGDNFEINTEELLVGDIYILKAGM